MAPDDAPTTIRTARGAYRVLRRRADSDWRPWLVTLDRLEAERFDATRWRRVVAWRCPDEWDARRVAARLDVQVREGIIE